jgi:hypothetical protein
MTVMGTITTVDELLTRAFELAYFILGDRTIAIYVAMSAVDNLKIASTAQDRRFDYTPVGRFTYPAIRTKIRLSEPHLLQRLIYAESEPFERLLEAQRHSSQEDMIIRFVKHLVRITIRHNSFYLSLGLCRLLYKYTTIETAKFYDFLIQDPDRAKDDYYYRSRKQHLMREMKKRFGDSVQTYRGHRGEERFQAQEDSAKYMALIQECLRRLTPWLSDCVLPVEFDPHANIIAPLLFEGEDPDEEHQVELNRIHTMLHPDCFGRLIANLGLDAPRERLEIPQFFEVGNDQRLSSDRFKPAPLNWDEVDSVKRYLERNEAHRKIASAESLSLLVDGDERARFSVYSATGIQFAVKENAESIELRSFESDEEVPLAIHLLAYGESGILPSAFSIKPKHRQNLDFEIQVESEPSGETACGLVRVDLRNVETITVGTILRRRLMLRDAVQSMSKGWAGGALLRFATAILFVVIALVGSLVYFKYRERPSNQTLVAERRQPDQQTAPLPVKPAMPSQTESPPAPPGNIRPRAAQRSGNAFVLNPKQGSESTRRAEWVSDSAMLLTVKRVYVDPFGDGSLGRRVREMLVTDLRGSNRFLVVENRDDADAVFKGVAKASAEGRDRVSLVLRLVNAEGKVVWPLARETAARKHTGTAREVSDYALKTLLNDMTRLEHAR